MSVAASSAPVTAGPAARVVGLSAPTETPECESSTGHGISTPEAVELHTAWPGWLPMLAIALFVLCTVGFMVGRILAW